MERKVILYLAMSLDGFIADKNGGVRLFPPEGPALPLRLTRHTVCNGVVELVYVRRDAPPPV